MKDICFISGQTYIQQSSMSFSPHIKSFPYLNNKNLCKLLMFSLSQQYFCITDMHLNSPVSWLAPDIYLKTPLETNGK